LGDLGFAVVSGLTVNNEMVGYREGGMNTHPHKFLGQADFAAVTFSRGVFEKQDQLYKWQQFLHSWNQASGLSSTNNNDYRCDVVVKVYDHPNSSGNYGTPGVSYPTNVSLGNARWGFKLFDCFPGSYSVSDLNAGDSGLMIQQMVLHHEGFVIAWDKESVDQLVTATG
jgi:phage tail-like protein